MYQKQSHTNNSLFRESIEALETHIQHANTLAAALPPDDDGDSEQMKLSAAALPPDDDGDSEQMKLSAAALPPDDDGDSEQMKLSAAALPPDDDGDSVQMKLSFSTFAPFLLYLIDWMDYTCTDSLPSYLGVLHILVYKVYVDGIQTKSTQERRATLREFYAVIYPSLKQLDGYLIELKDVDDNKKIYCKDVSKDDECGICMETNDKVALPNCGHSMCIGCFRDWNKRSKSCPFCRGNLKKIHSGDLWVLTNETDLVDLITLAKENLKCFYLYIESLSFDVPDTHFLLYEYLI